MAETKHHPFKKWEVSIMKIQEGNSTIYKVTRRIAQLSVAETKIFKSKEEAKKQFEAWLE
ncbi:MAG: hypothetical protein AABX31_01710 [Nanoarchaeota archaeon]